MIGQKLTDHNKLLSDSMSLPDKPCIPKKLHNHMPLSLEIAPTQREAKLPQIIEDNARSLGRTRQHRSEPFNDTFPSDTTPSANLRQLCTLVLQCKVEHLFLSKHLPSSSPYSPSHPAISHNVQSSDMKMIPWPLREQRKNL